MLAQPKGEHSRTFMLCKVLEEVVAQMHAVHGNMSAKACANLIAAELLL